MVTEKDRSLIETAFKECGVGKQPTRVDVLRRCSELGIKDAERKIQRTYGNFNSMLFEFGFKPPKVNMVTKSMEEDMIKQCLDFVALHGRYPDQREFRSKYGFKWTMSVIYKQFGGWSNYLIKCGKKATDHKTSRTRKSLRSIDGHICDSNGEVAVDNWLYAKTICHSIHFVYPGQNCPERSKLNADFYLPQYQLVIEYTGFGEINDAKLASSYKLRMNRKLELAKSNNLQVICIPTIDQIDHVLSDQFRKA